MNDRLQEISDLVDEIFINRQNCIENHNTVIDEDIVSYGQQNNFIPRFDTSKMEEIEKLFNINDKNSLYGILNKSKYYFYEIKYYNKNINNMKFMTLSKLYVSVLYCLNKQLLKKFANKYIIYSDQYEQYMNRFSDKKQRYDILMYMNKCPYSYDKFIDIVNRNKPYTIVIDDIDKYKNSINEIKMEISNTSKPLNNIINPNDENHRIFYNIINVYHNKIEQMYRFISKFNNPEMIIYNFIVEQIKDKPTILNIFTHFTLPVKRQNSTHPLYADILVIFDFGNTFHFAVIEYDGPTHSNIYDFRFQDSIVFCDIAKNKFCIDNNISLIRLNYKTSINEQLNTINNIFEQIIITKKTICQIPSDEHYKQILNDYYAKNK